MNSAPVPKKFFGLHSHTGASTYDGMGPAEDHFKFALSNGLDGMAITEHGHMNSFAQAYLFNQKWKKAGTLFKYIPGVEAYYHPSLEQWAQDRALYEEAKEDKKLQKKLKKREEGLKNIGVKTDDDDDIVDIEMSNALTIENEDETRNIKAFNPLNRRHHLVVLPKTSGALKKIFHIVSRGYIEGFYRFPRIDLGMILKEAKDDIILSSACLGGPISYAVLQTLRTVNFDDLNPEILDDENIMRRVLNEIGNIADPLISAVGVKNFLLELQFHKIPAQDVVNRAIIEFAKRNGMTEQLIATCDSHYPRPDLWRHREMYKKLGFMNYSELGPESLPKSVEDVKALLYPKNAEQMWEGFKQRQDQHKFYREDGVEQLVCDAIERTHDIAHNVIEDIKFDQGYKYPKSVVPSDTTEFKYLCKLVKDGMIKKGLDKKPEYVERMKYELSIIKKLDNASYFVTLAGALRLARDVCLLGVARGSSGGSLVVYLLEITDIDPLKYNLSFERFLNPYRVGCPDIDCDISDRDKVLEVLREKFGMNNVIPISNINTFKVKTLLKDISKFYGIPFEEANEATKTVEKEVRKATMKHGDDKNLFVLKFEDAMKYSESFRSFIERHPEVAESMEILFKEQRSLGRHAGGVVIMDDAMGEMPLITNGGEPQTPWVEGVGGKTLEPNGIIKYDLLGLETMRLIENTVEKVIKGKGGIKQIELEDGTVMRLLPDQLVMTQRGEVFANELKDDDEILTP